MTKRYSEDPYAEEKWDKLTSYLKMSELEVRQLMKDIGNDLHERLSDTTYSEKIKNKYNI